MNGKKSSRGVIGHDGRNTSSSEKELASESSLRKRKVVHNTSSSDGETSDEDEEDDDEDDSDNSSSDNEEQKEVECQVKEEEIDKEGECEDEEGEEEEEQEEEEEEQEEDEEPLRRRRSTRRAARTNVIGSDDSNDSVGSSSVGARDVSHGRSQRRTKRPHDSGGESEGTTGSSEKSSLFVTDHDYGVPRRSSRKPPRRVHDAATEDGRTSKRSHVQTRNRGQQLVRYREQEDSDWTGGSEDDDDENDGLDSRAREVLSVSSRGRLRKLSKHAARAMVAQ